MIGAAACTCDARGYVFCVRAREEEGPDVRRVRAFRPFETYELPVCVGVD